MKHNYFKHLFAALLLLCSTVATAHDFEVDGFYYNILPGGYGTVEVTYKGTSFNEYSNEYTGDVVIPNSVTYNGSTYSVNRIGERAFSYCSGITSVVIPKSVASVENYAFSDCSSLTNLHIENAGTALSFGSYGNSENGATRFQGCPLVTVYLGRNLSYYYNANVSNVYAPFYNIKTLKKVTIGNNVGSIGEKLFDYSGMECLIIGRNVTSIKNVYSYNTSCSIKSIVNFSSLNITKGSTEYGGIARNAEYVYNNCTTVDDFVFSTSGSVNYLVAYTGNETSIELPDGYNGGNYEIAGFAFSGCTGLESVEIPNSVTSIGQKAFYDCSGLKSVTVGTQVLGIHDKSFPKVNKFIFLGNTRPTRLDYPSLKYKPESDVIYVSNAEVYGYGTEYPRLSSMFEVGGVKYVPLSTKECDVIDCCYDVSAANLAVDSIVMYKSRKMTVKNINNYSFYNNKYIKQAYVNNDGYVGAYAFYDCDSIVGDVVVENNGYVGSSAFYDCDGIENVNISNNGYVGSSAFKNCDGIENVNISNNGYIGMSAFLNCTNLVTANVHNKGYIGGSAFQDCVSLQNLVLGENVGSLGASAFKNCSSLQELAIPNNIPSMGAYCFSDCASLRKMAVGTGIVQLSEGVFKNCISLIDMSIGVNVNSVMAKVFYNCSSLPAINIPQATKIINDSVFYDCKKLALVVFENRADSIVLGSNGKSPMFSSCSLDSVYVGGKLEYDKTEAKGYSPFYGNKYLKSVTFNDSEVAVYDKEFMGCSYLRNVTLGNGIKEIGAEAFRNCSALPRITIPNSVNTMGKFAFARCYSLKKALIGDGTDGIKESTFEDCTSLVDIKLGVNIGAIELNSFRNCSSLPEITIPQATVSIADGVFYNCKSLARFFVEDGSRTLSIGAGSLSTGFGGEIVGGSAMFGTCSLDSVYLGRNLSYNQTEGYDYSPFYFNKTLRAVVIGDGVKAVFPNQFYQCRKLEYVSVGNGVISVGDRAFSGCSSLDHFSFGVGLETIGKEAFSDCTLVTKIVSSREVPPVCGDQALADIDMWECTVYVPEDYIDAYMNADQWCDFWIEGAEYRLRFVVDGEVYSEEMVKYNAEIELPADPEKTGYTFKGWNLPGYKPVFEDVKLAENADAMLYTNAPCTTSAYGDQFVSWDVLFDGNLNTLFHSEYGNKQTVDGLDHYLRVDMGEGNKVGKFKFTYTTRNVVNNNNVSPKTIVVEGSNTPDGEYTEIATLTNLPGTKATVYTSDVLGNEETLYRYIRYRVTETHSGYTDNGHPYFAIAEFGMSFEETISKMPVKMPAYDMTVYAEFETNDYSITYIVDGEVYETVTVAYDAVITPIEAPEKDGYTFNRWEALPQTMPAENIEVVAIYDEIPTEIAITVGKYGTTVYSSPYALDFSEVKGLKAYAATGYNKNTGVITMTKVETSRAAVGLYLVAEPGEYIVPIIESSDDNSLNMLVGVLEKTTVYATSGDGQYANYRYVTKTGDTSPKFYQSTVGGASVSAGKAYLQIPLAWLGGNASKSVGIRFDDGETTDIEELDSESKEAIYYDLQGRRVENPSNGIYIVNGKKVWVK